MFLYFSSDSLMGRTYNCASITWTLQPLLASSAIHTKLSPCRCCTIFKDVQKKTVWYDKTTMQHTRHFYQFAFFYILSSYLESSVSTIHFHQINFCSCVFAVESHKKVWRFLLLNCILRKPLTWLCMLSYQVNIKKNVPFLKQRGSEVVNQPRFCIGY